MNILKALATTAVVAVVGVLWAGCGGPDNASACKDYVDHVTGLSCLSGPAGDAIKKAYGGNYCDQYNNTSEDLTSYFDCLSSHIKCDGKNIDTTEYAKIGTCTPPSQ